MTTKTEWSHSHTSAAIALGPHWTKEQARVIECGVHYQIVTNSSKHGITPGEVLVMCNTHLITPLNAQESMMRSHGKASFGALQVIYQGETLHSSPTTLANLQATNTSPRYDITLNCMLDSISEHNFTYTYMIKYGCSLCCPNIGKREFQHVVLHV